MEQLMEIEQRLESDMLSAGYHQFIRETFAAKEGERESTTIYGNTLIRHAIEPVAERIKKFLAEQVGTGTRPKVATSVLLHIDPSLAAFIALRVLIDKISKGKIAVATAAISIGTAIETELRLEEFADQYGKLFATVSASLDRRTSNLRHRRTVLLHVAGKHSDTGEKWSQNFRLHVGMAMLTFVIEETGLFREEMIWQRNQSRRVIFATPDVLKLAADLTEQAALLSPHRGPMVVPPKAWTSMSNGGYYFMPKGTQQLVKDHSGNRKEEIDNLIPAMPSVIEALNIAQGTPWAVNKGVLAVAKQLWENDVAVGGLDRFDPQPIPPKPVDIDTNEAALTAWKMETRAVHEANQRSLSKRVQTARTVSIATQYASYSHIYFPHEFDFRGRVYPVPGLLNPQGGDLARGLIEFADGMVIDGVEAERWYFIQGANTFGVDKLSLDGRVAWTAEKYEQILEVGRDPLAHTWWHEADSPWQFLAFCLDFVKWHEDAMHESRLVVAMDGSCNGLQHFSAMLRDSVGGAATNLTPSDTPADIYQQVADIVTVMLDKEVTEGNDVDTVMALRWLLFGIDRKVTKRPVMVLPYGGTLHSCRFYIEEAVAERDTSPFTTEEMWKATYWLAVRVWAAIGETVVAAREAMDWLQEVAKIMAKAGLPMTWVMPDGFPVFQNYMNQKDRRIKTRLGEKIIQVSMYHNTDRIDGGKQALATSPNFVHSYDALCLRHYLLIAYDNGIRHFATVHDSYGVHAANAPMSAACLREAFVDVYTSVDPLARLDAEVRAALTDEEAEALPPLPTKGTLNIEKVKDAEYFFA